MRGAVLVSRVRGRPRRRSVEWEGPQSLECMAGELEAVGSESVEWEVDCSEWESRELGLGLTWSVECQCEADSDGLNLGMSN
jgi:hypothetical protein